MIFSKDLVFLHVPKTGGMSLTRFLLDMLPKPVYYVAPLVPLEQREGITHIQGIRHENLENADAILSAHGMELKTIPLILSVIRNPYELEVSRYAYLRKGQLVDQGFNQDLAISADFTSFAEHSLPHTKRPIESYFRRHGQVPPNLKVARFETLEKDVREILGSIGLTSLTALPRDNASSHGDYRLYYNSRAEKSVYRRYQWVFDSGLYPRMNRWFLFLRSPRQFQQAALSLLGRRTGIESRT